ncbi:MAG: carbamoyltransferase [Candidatus Marinimicrobia bacterium]|nr:carbamoyltransferase [Candidatus Neomarinimicrobiota bacterium]
MNNSQYIIGISAFYHDSAACLLKNGRILAAAQEERFTRKKHDADFPLHAIRYCLIEAGIDISDLDLVAFYDKPLLKFERLLETYLTYAPLGVRSFLTAMPVWLKRKLWIPRIIERELGYSGDILFPEHHHSHAAAAFFPSPFDRAAFLTMDGVGEWATTSWGIGLGNSLEIRNEIHFPHSLGLLYSAFTYYTGFRVNSGEYKVMGLAPYGEPKYVNLIRDNLIDIKTDGSFRLDMRYFNYAAGLTMTNSRFNELFGGLPRQPESELTQREMDLASSLQVVTEEVMEKAVRHIVAETGEKKLCLAGGVALNCVSNGRILRSGAVEDLWVQPAAGDAGGALGAALAAWHQYRDEPRTVSEKNSDRQNGSYLGPSYSTVQVETFLRDNNIPFTVVDDPAKVGAELIAGEKVVGWFQGRMEFGPRALGNRSIIGDARSEAMQTTMNLKIKYRESFRPFAPSVLEEDISDWFAIDRPSPYMLLVAAVHPDKLVNQDRPVEAMGLDKLKLKRSLIPAITHVDNSARIQSVNKTTNPLYHRLISEFKKLTGCPVIVNTSFNVRGEPIVATPIDAYRCFMRTEMDYLIIGSFLLDKTGQPQFVDKIDWRQTYELD